MSPMSIPKTLNQYPNMCDQRSVQPFELCNKPLGRMQICLWKTFDGIFLDCRIAQGAHSQWLRSHFLDKKLNKIISRVGNIYIIRFYFGQMRSAPSLGHNRADFELFSTIGLHAKASKWIISNCVFDFDYEIIQSRQGKNVEVAPDWCHYFNKWPNRKTAIDKYFEYDQRRWLGGRIIAV